MILERLIKDGVEDEVAEILISLGIPVNLQGFHYLRKAIKLAVEYPQTMRRITKDLYPEVAKECGVTESRVERAIRHAILVSYNKNKIVNLNQVFNLNIFNNYDKPTNSELIALIADRLITKYRLLNAK